MLDSFGAALRALREQHHLSLADLAERTNYSKSYLGNLETGAQPAHDAVATACDEALGSTPLLTVMLSVERGDLMYRRVLLGGALAATGGAIMATMDGTTALAAAINAGLNQAVGGPVDWDAVAADFARRHVLASSPQLGAELAAQITIAQHHADPDALRGAAQLALTYGLWTADTGRVATAHGLYATAAKLADRTGDTQLRALVRARAASRGPYEGWTAKRTSDTAHMALSMTDRGPAAVEAYSAMVHLCALTGRLTAGRAYVRAMYELADADTGGPSTYLRAVSFDNYLECRAGSLADAQAAHDDRCFGLLAPVPLWQAEATIYLGRALVAAGAVDAGARLALDAIRALPTRTRIVGIGVRDVLSVVPAGVRSEAVAALRGYASPGPAPWEVLS